MTGSGKPTRVIVAAQCNEHSHRLAGVSSKRFYTDALTFARTQLLVTEYYGFDAPNNTWDVYNIEAEAMGQKIVFHERSIPDVDRTDPLIKSPSDLDHLRPPDPFRSGRMPWVHEVNRRYMELTGKPARVFFCAPFSLAVNIRGYANLIDDIQENPGFAHRLFAFLCEEVLAPYITAMRTAIGQPGALADGNDAWASPPMITLGIMDDFVVAYTERLRSLLGPKVVTRGNWGDSRSRDPGFPEEFMARKLKTSPGFLSVLDPDLYRLGPGRVKTFADRHGAHLTAGVDATLLQTGPVEAIIERIRAYIDAMARDGRCAIYLNQIPGDAPPGHIHAAVAACRALGSFPIPENLDAVPVDVPEKESFVEFLRRKGVRLEG